MPPHKIISYPVHTAACPRRAVGAAAASAVSTNRRSARFTDSVSEKTLVGSGSINAATCEVTALGSPVAQLAWNGRGGAEGSVLRLHSSAGLLRHLGANSRSIAHGRLSPADLRTPDSCRLTGGAPREGKSKTTSAFDADSVA